MLTLQSSGPVRKATQAAHFHVMQKHDDFRWPPISEAQIWDQINEAESRMRPDVARLWEFVRVLPHKWNQHPWGGECGGFWVVAIFGSRVVWFNDIEDGFNVSQYKVSGEIAEYWCNQSNLDDVIEQLLYEIQQGVAPVGFASPPVDGVFGDA